MPIDYQQIYTQIKVIGQGAKDRQKRKEERQAQARALLSAYASQLDVLRNKVDSAKAADPNIRCALPLNEPLDFSGPPPASIKEVTLIAADGSQAGVMSRYDALQMATSAGLDLVEVSPTAEPPVVRVMDYGKFLFEQNKKAHSAKKKQKQIQVKEVKFRPGTDENDYQVKLRNLIRFLTEGDKAKVTLRFRGREMAHQEIGRKLLDRVVVDLAGVGSVEQNPLMEGRQMVMVFAPKKK